MRRKINYTNPDRQRELTRLRARRWRERERIKKTLPVVEENVESV